MSERQRTAGDGMESVSSVVDPGSNESKPTNRPRLIEVVATNFLPDSRPNINKKSPKFVPYEPYPAAIKPIIPVSKQRNPKKSRNNLDINVLINQLSLVDTKQSEFRPRPKRASQSDSRVLAICEDVKLQSEIEELKKENESIREQLTNQVQVNRELKTMLIASMGEDLESQVETLNKDKQHLTSALLDSATHLSTHQEQTEWLAGQCEVWRSKFLASSLMIEELANWKKVLSKRACDSEKALEKVLEERNRIRELLMLTYKSIYSMHEEWLSNLALSELHTDFKKPIGNINLSNSRPVSSNLIDLATSCMKMAQNISDRYDKCDTGFLMNLPSSTEGEKMAETLLATPLEVLKENEAPLHALVNHAYTQSSTAAARTPVAACSHCNGNVQLL